ncbi:MAG: copper resistance protein NlpE [Gemmatimonadaceae bacterium]|jgi:hypothetical protein|nr:copper resistance protein NlpE [Gemmatimonadaceae bacterium]MCU0626855.1 copper resistance protein NlpE [Gemmatimonadaceae bacterium]
MPLSVRSASLVLASVLAAGCAQSGKKPRLPAERVVGDWQSDTLPAADAPGRVYALRIERGGRADFTSTYVGRPVLVQRGTWDGADSLLRLVVRENGTGTPESLLFVVGDSTLVLRGDPERWGSEGLVLRRR